MTNTFMANPNSRDLRPAFISELELQMSNDPEIVTSSLMPFMGASKDLRFHEVVGDGMEPEIRRRDLVLVKPVA